MSSYNGGKDACVIMNLHRVAHAKYYMDLAHNNEILNLPPPVPQSPRVLYFDNPDEFPEIAELLKSTVVDFDLHMTSLKGCSFAEGLDFLLKAGQEGGKRNNMAFILGTRKGDPNWNQQEKFSPSSQWMPPFMRVNPVMDWTYGERFVFHYFFIYYYFFFLERKKNPPLISYIPNHPMYACIHPTYTSRPYMVLPS